MLFWLMLYNSEKGGEAIFHPLIAEWFRQKYGNPTPIQTLCWSKVSDGGHLLLTAPTGSGKTLAAFLWSLNQLITGQWAPGAIRVLYISPLKALNQDIRVNLTGPLQELQTWFPEEGPLTAPRIGIRSGDTTQAERRRIQRHPPEILITTPESLNILLTAPKSRDLLKGLKQIIIDEVHAIAGNKRGTHLMTAVERLTLLSGEFQRLAISATVEPKEEVARFIGGRQLERREGIALYRERRVEILTAPEEKRYDLRVCYPGSAAPGENREEWWHALTREFQEIAEGNRSTLFFANSRRMVEKVTRFLNEEQDLRLAYAHHGSLSRELRREVERKMKEGELKAIVATNSLELGIDIGTLSEVILLQPPPNLASTLQRLGRAGHRVGEVSRGRLYPLHPGDLIPAAVCARAVAEREIEPLNIPAEPLDVLAQVLVSMTGHSAWDRDELYDFIRTIYPYRELLREQYESVIRMLTGYYQHTRIRELAPRLALDADDNRLQAREGQRYHLYLSGGTIPDRGYYALRVQGSGARIGELDEEFVWERSIGDHFILGTQGWRIVAISERDVEVIPVPRQPGMTPFWKGEAQGRSFLLAERCGRLIEELEAIKPEGRLVFLKNEYRMEQDAAQALLTYLRRQREHPGERVDGTPPLPHRHRLVIEHLQERAAHNGHRQIIIHTGWGGMVNAPLALALRQAWKRSRGFRLETFHDDHAIVLNLPEEGDSRELLSLVHADNLLTLIRGGLEETGHFGGRFRENAGRALLLPKKGFKSRTPLWLTRLKAKRLLEALGEKEDFPMVLETWRTCLQEDFDIPHLKALLEELESGGITISDFISRDGPSPLAENLVWQQTNTFMYGDDTPQGRDKPSLSDSLFRQLIQGGEELPDIAPEIIAELQQKLQRTAEEYTPRDGRELLEHLKERRWIPRREWNTLIQAMRRDRGDELLKEALQYLKPKRTAAPLGENGDGICAGENRTSLARAFQPHGQEKRQPAQDERLRLLPEYLKFYGPVRISFIAEATGYPESDLREDLFDLVAQKVLLQLTDEKDPLICEAENYERLLRLRRRRARSPLPLLPPEELPRYMASWHGLSVSGAAPGEKLPDAAKLRRRMEQLWGYTAPVHLWEEEILPARLPGYSPGLLDSLTAETDLLWAGAGKEKLYFTLPADRPLFTAERSGDRKREQQDDDPLPGLFPDPGAIYPFWTLKERSGLKSAELTRLLWQELWKGRLSCDRYAVIRQGIQEGFKAVDTADAAVSKRAKGPRRPGTRGGFNRWQAALPQRSGWFRLLPAAAAEDPLDREDQIRERILILLDRYGILFREILQRELPQLRWGRIFGRLRLMELGGEVIGGSFFQGIPGIQFASPEGLRHLKKTAEKNDLPGVYSLNAWDPASLCGTGLPRPLDQLPRRLPGNTLIYRGSELLLTAERHGQQLTFRLEPEDPRLPALLSPLKERVHRSVNPVNRLKVATINGEPAPESAYSGALERDGFRRGYKFLTYP